MRKAVAVAFASREIATLGELGRPRLEIHVGVAALGMAALAGLGTIISHGRWRPARGQILKSMRRIVLDLMRGVPCVLCGTNKLQRSYLIADIVTPVKTLAGSQAHAP